MSPGPWGSCTSRPLGCSPSACLPFRHRSSSLWLSCIPQTLDHSYKLGQISSLWLNSLHRLSTFIWFCFGSVSFETLVFIGSICFWSPGRSRLHPARTSSSAPLFRALTLRHPPEPASAGSPREPRPGKFYALLLRLASSWSWPCDNEMLHTKSFQGFPSPHWV